MPIHSNTLPHVGSGGVVRELCIFIIRLAQNLLAKQNLPDMHIFFPNLGTWVKNGAFVC